METGAPARPARARSPPGLRGYAPGDALRRVHWRASLRRGALLVREQEQECTGETVVRLRTAGCAPGAAFEEAVRRAASEVAANLRSGLRVACAPTRRCSRRPRVPASAADCSRISRWWSGSRPGPSRSYVRAASVLAEEKHEPPRFRVAVDAPRPRSALAMVGLASATLAITGRSRLGLLLRARARLGRPPRRAARRWQRRRWILNLGLAACIGAAGRRE